MLDWDSRKRGSRLRLFFDGCLDKTNETKYLYQPDVQGNIVAMLDNVGNVVVKYKYDAWGKCLVLNPDGTENTSATFVGNKNPFRYRGYYYCRDLGFYYLKSRFYDPEIGRFISPDATSYLAPDVVNGLNLYAYCNNNPVMNVDPEGHAWWEWALAVAVVAATVVAVAVCAVALGPLAAGVAIASGVVSAGASAAGQYEETGKINIGQLVYDGAFGVINGALATSGISFGASIIFGSGLGGVSSIGSDLLFNDGNIDVEAAIDSTLLGGLGGMISGAGAKKDILKLAHSQKILNRTIANGTKRALVHQTLVRNNHVKTVTVSAIRFAFSSFITGFASKGGFTS